MVILGLLFVVGCGPSRYVPEDNRIIIKDKPYRENFTSPILKNFIKSCREENRMPQIVVRGIGETGSISSSSNSNRICSILETALAKNQFDVRDRAIFESVLASNANNDSKALKYSDLNEATEVDLLMEITNYSLNDYYYVEGYYDAKGVFHKFDRVNLGSKKQPQWITPRYLFRGMSLTIKVILLKDNLVGGSYSYSYVPCSEESGGASILQLYPLRYRVKSEARDVDAIMDDNQSSSLIESRGQRLDRAMEQFLSTEVVPGLMMDIEGQSGSSSFVRIEPESRPLVMDGGAGRGAAGAIKETPRLTNNKLRETVQARTEKTRGNSYEKDGLSHPQSQSFSEPRNSAGIMTKAISDMIERKFSQQISEEKGKIKKPKEQDYFEKKISAITTLLEKLNYLNNEAISDINKFILSSLSPSGNQAPSTDASSVSFFLPMNESYQDTIIYLFVDGQCVGIGSDLKGLYSKWEMKSFSSSFHQLVIIGSNAKTSFKKKLFESEVLFDVRNEFVFIRNPRTGLIKDLGLL